MSPTLHRPLPPTVTQAEAEAGALTDPRTWPPQRIAQAIEALGGGGGPEILSTTGGMYFDDSGPQTQTIDLALTAGSWQIFAGFRFDTSWSMGPQMLWEPNMGFQAKGFAGYTWRIVGWDESPTFMGGGIDGADHPIPTGEMGMAMGSWFGGIWSPQTVQIIIHAEDECVVEEACILAIKLG